MEFVFLNGSFLRADQAKVGVLDHGFLYGDGVYETLRTYGGEVWQLGLHLERLQKSAALVSIKLPWKMKQVGLWVEKLVRMHGYKESRVRITVTRGENGFEFTGSKRPTILIQVLSLRREPAVVYEKGVSAVTVKIERVLPEAKSTSLLPFVAARQVMKKEKAYEAIFVDAKNYVREGTATNVFMVQRGIVFTPKSKILKGTTRQVLLKLLKKSGIKAREKDFKMAEFLRADEVFITNAPKGIVPVDKINGRKVGKGPVTEKIMKLFADYVAKQTV